MMRNDAAPLGRRSTSHLGEVVREEWGGVPWRVRLSCVVARTVPRHAGYRIRTLLLRAWGWDLHRTTVFAGVPEFSGAGPLQSRLTIGARSWVNVGCHLELSDRISIGDDVAIGHDVLILTSTHQVGRRDRRAGPMTSSPVSVGDGAWIGSRSVLLPGVVIGEGAVVSAGSVVTADVAPNCVVAGAPAQVVVPRLPG